MQELYADVIVDISHEKVDKPFQYKVPEKLKEMLKPGMCVKIPFGKGNHIRSGYIIEITDQAAYRKDKIKEIQGIAQEAVSVTGDAIRMAYWMKKNYGSTMIAALRVVLPAKKSFQMKEKKKIVRTMTQEETRNLIGQCKQKNQNAKVRILSALLKEEVLPYELVSKKLNISASTLNALCTQSAIRIESESYYRNPVKLDEESDVARVLSKEQEVAVRGIREDYAADIRKVYCIRGVTGSGKTEVYMSLIKWVVDQGKQCIVLIPEIALTYQTLLRFYKRFGDRVSVMNSTLSPGEKYDQCERAKKGEIDVIIGPRSALFVPFPNLGLIIMDEEHEPSYKSEAMPKYHARECAAYLAKIKHASLILGSATPSLETWHRVKTGEYQLYELRKRITGEQLPTVYTVDLREELKKGNRSIFSIKLQKLIQDRLDKKEQIILFINRRGYAGFISCRSCGYVMKCIHCDVSLSKHKGGRMICHYCGYETSEPRKCPECSSAYITGFRAGTQQIEEHIGNMFPAARVLRMDADTTKKKESYDRILSAFAQGEADILLGTQMIVKGHDFPDVTLVGILAADLSLNDNDYRAGERTFQLLTQAAGRAGRGDKPGEVVIQTYRPEHYSIVHASTQDYEAFYEEEIVYRQLMSYPPVSHMLAILVTAKSEEDAKETSAGFVRVISQSSGVIIGPAPAAIGKISDSYRYIMYVKHKNYDALTSVKDRIEELIKNDEQEKKYKYETVQFDFDPM